MTFNVTKNYTKKSVFEDEEMAQQLRVLAILAEDLGCYQHPCGNSQTLSPVQGNPTPSSGPCRHQVHTWDTYIHAVRFIYIKQNLNFFSRQGLIM